jgi:hypothetical protein
MKPWRQPGFVSGTATGSGSGSGSGSGATATAGAAPFGGARRGGRGSAPSWSDSLSLDDAEARSGRLESLAEDSDRRSGGILGPSAAGAWPFCCCAWPFCALRAALGGMWTRRALRLGLFGLEGDFAARFA